MSVSRLEPHRDEIFAEIAQGTSKAEIARNLDVPVSTLKSWVQNQSAVRAPDEHLGLGHDATVSDQYVEIPVFHRKYDLDCLNVYPLGDVHLGSEAHDSNRWEEWLHFLYGRDDVSLLGTGDYLNSALKTSVSETYDEVMNVGKAKRKLRSQLAPLANQDKIDLLMPGNHEARIYKAVGDCPIEDVADALGTNYAQHAAVVIYEVGEVSYVFYIRHGTGGGGVGARANRLQKQSQVVLADVYVSGHTHSSLAFPDEIFDVDFKDQKVFRRRRYYVSSGSFLRYEGYAASSSFNPTKIGAPRIFLDGTRKDIHVST
jgi:hypothetical protein